LADEEEKRGKHMLWLDVEKKRKRSFFLPFFLSFFLSVYLWGNEEAK